MGTAPSIDFRVDQQPRRPPCDLKSREQAIEWVKRCPNPFETDSEIEIRQVFEAPELTGNEEIIRKEAELRAQSADNAKR